MCYLFEKPRSRRANQIIYVKQTVNYAHCIDFLKIAFNLAVSLEDRKPAEGSTVNPTVTRLVLFNTIQATGRFWPTLPV